MFNVGGGEILLIALLALIVVGPEQLPGLLRKLGYYAAQARQMSTSLRAEFMAGAEPFQDSVREFQRGMTDFSHTLSDAADPKKWAEGTPNDESGQSAGSETAEAIPARTKQPKLEITPPPNPWAALPGSGAETSRDETAEAETSADEGAEAETAVEVASPDRESDTDQTELSPEARAAADQLEKNRIIAPAVPVPPPLTGYKPDDEAEHAVESAPDEESV
jgi:sec-independent protein translocase protein TatB